MKHLLIILSFNAAMAGEILSPRLSPLPVAVQTVEAYNTFLRETKQATLDQIIYRSNEKFSGDRAYNKFFEGVIEDLKSNGAYKEASIYQENIEKLEYIWNHCLLNIEDCALKFKAKATRNDNDVSIKILALQGMEVTFTKQKNYLARWATTLQLLYRNQIHKLEAKQALSKENSLCFTESTFKRLLWKINDILTNIKSEITQYQNGEKISPAEERHTNPLLGFKLEIPRKIESVSEIEAVGRVESTSPPKSPASAQAKPNRVLQGSRSAFSNHRDTLRRKQENDE
ncbi:hypothetical protein [Candidatus Odyssella thessalonicensis]|uniref:hypothetical protein n=1 Tax=Candidatus Odyssella thessalonicensis TaxID=84647 RepID=UPI000225B909|nr:hypothetical protein [Candidatus Odyssella thessalonicensis]